MQVVQIVPDSRMLLVAADGEPSQIVFAAYHTRLSLKDKSWWVAYLDLGLPISIVRNSTLTDLLSEMREFDTMMLARPTGPVVQGITSGVVAAFSNYDDYHNPQKPQAVLAHAAKLLRTHQLYAGK